MSDKRGDCFKCFNISGLILIEQPYIFNIQLLIQGLGVAYTLSDQNAGLSLESPFGEKDIFCCFISLFGYHM